MKMIQQKARANLPGAGNQECKYIAQYCHTYLFIKLQKSLQLHTYWHKTLYHIYNKAPSIHHATLSFDMGTMPYLTICYI